jgi:TP901 family phage tail tape measure protein
MPRELIIPFLITANYQTSLAIRQLRGELGQLPAELTAMRAAAAEVYAMGAMGLFSLGMLAVGAQQLASALVSAQQMAALAAVATNQFAATSAVANEILRQSASVSRSYGQSLGEIAAAFLEAARAGMTISQAAALIPEAMNLAETSGADLAETVRMTFAIMRNLGMPITRQFARMITSELSYALDKSLMDIEDVMHAIKYAGPIAGQLGVPLHDLFSALMLLHDAGIRASIAGTGLARMLIRLEAPTAQARRELAKLGIDWHELRPSAQNLADIIDLLAANADELTIRLLLGERAERAFYAIVQQGTDALREHARELRQHGENASYAEQKYRALAQTPAQRFRVAIATIRNSMTLMVEPLFRLQLTVAEALAGLVRTVSDSPLLRAISKMVIGFGALFGGITLVISSLAWLAGRFLELSTIGSHFLMVIDRLQASLGNLTLSALRVPMRGFVEGLKAFFLPGGLERMATWLSRELRFSELASAMAQPLVFWRRARRIPPLLQVLPEEIAMRHRSIAGAVARLGIPLQQFLFLGLGLGPARPSTLRFRDYLITYLQDRAYQYLIESFRNIPEALLDALINAVAQVQLSPQTVASLRTVLKPRLVKVIKETEFKGDFEQFWANVKSSIMQGIAVQDEILTASELQMLGFQMTLQDRARAASLFLQKFDEIRAQMEDVTKQQIFSFFMRRPELMHAARLSGRAAEMLSRFSRFAPDLTLQQFFQLADQTYKAVQEAVRAADIEALPFLAEYQRKVQSVMRESNLPGLLRALFMGTMSLPADALLEAMQFNLGAIVGLAARRLPRRTDRFRQFFERLVDEVSIYFSGVSDLVSAGVRFGLGLASAITVIPDITNLKPIIQGISDQLTKLRARRFLGIATPEEMAQISRLQQQLGMMLGVAAASELQEALSRLKSVRGRIRRRISGLFDAVQKFGTGGMRELREALLNLGIDMPELIGRLLRESSAFVRHVEAQLLQLPNSNVLIQQFRQLARSVFAAHKGLQALFGKQGMADLHKRLVQLGLTEEQATQVIQILISGMLQFLAEQAALGKNLQEAADAVKRLTEPTWLGRLLSGIGNALRNFILAQVKALTSRHTWLYLRALVSVALSQLRARFPTQLAAIQQALSGLGSWVVAFLRALSASVGVPFFTARGAFGQFIRSIREMFQKLGSYFQQAITPIFSQLAKLPQMMVGLDIFRRIKIPGAWSRFAKAFAFLFRFWLFGLLTSLMADMFPIEDIGRIIGLTERQIVEAKVLIEYYKRFFIGMLPRTLYAFLDLLVIAPIKGLVTGDFVGSMINAFQSWIGSLEAQWKAVDDYRKSLEREMQAMITSTADAMRDAMTSIADLISSQTKQLVGLRNNISQKLSELYNALGAVRMTGPEVAPPGIGKEWDQIGELALFYRDALEDLKINLENFNRIGTQLQTILDISKKIKTPATEIAQAAESLKGISAELWDRPKTKEKVQQILRSMTIDVSSLTSRLEEIRNNLQALPEDQRVAYSGVIQWLDQAIKAGDDFKNVLYDAIEYPGRYRDKLIETMNAFIAVVNAEQIRTNLFTPVREALDDINERLSELKRRAGELLDPREVRERLLSLARAQFEALTAPFRALVEAQQAWSDFMSDLTGDVTKDAIDAANNLSAAFMNVLDVLARPALRPKEALEKLADAFELVGEDAKNIRVHIERLQQLLTSENFMATTPEALAEVRTELAKLGREVLEQLSRIRQLRDETARLRFEEMEDAIEAVSESYESIRTAVDRALDAESRYHHLVLQEAQLRYRMMVRLGVNPIIAQQRAWDWAQQQLRRRQLTAPSTLENLQSITSSLTDQFEELGDAYSATVIRSQVAGFAMQRYARYMTAAMQIISRTGRLTQQAATYMQRGYESFTQALRLSLDLRVAIAGIGAAFRELRDIFSELGTEYLSDLVSRVRMMPVVLATGLDRLRQLFTQRLLLSFRRGWDAFVARLRTEREIMNVWRILFPEPEDLANYFRDLADTIGSWIERGYLPSFVSMSMDQARTQFLDLLNWLRQFYFVRLQQLGELMSFVPFGTRVWLELLQAQLQVAKSLDDIEQKLRNIRMELVSLSLYAIPERLSQFLITEGPALWAFMRTGALGGVSTLNFTIHVTAQDVSVGIQQALQQAQRTLAGFTYRTIF